MTRWCRAVYSGVPFFGSSHMKAYREKMQKQVHQPTPLYTSPLILTIHPTGIRVVTTDGVAWYRLPPPPAP